MSNTFSVFEDWKKGLLGFVDRNQSQSDGFEDYLPTQGGTLNTAGGIKGSGINATMNRTSESPLIKKPMFNTQMFPPGQGQAKIGGKTFNIPKQMLTPDAQAKQAEAIKTAQVNASNKTPMGMPSDPIVTGGSGVKQAEDMGFMQKLSNMAGVDFDKAAANWKDKGGFEGLMSNPAFSLGLALMQSSANGKTINQGILDNFVKSAKISTEFKDRIEAKQGGVIEATEGQMDDIKSVLGTKGIDKPGWWRKILPGNQSEGYEQAVEDVAVKVQIKVKAMKKAAKNSGKDIVVGKRLYKKIIDDMIASGEIKNVGGVNIGGYQVIDSTLEAKAKGGPVESGKPYVVGEKGPEIIIPTSDGNVLSNDDSQIFSMLLASNPQLQKVSRQRAERVLRNRFPEYFEG